MSGPTMQLHASGLVFVLGLAAAGSPAAQVGPPADLPRSLAVARVSEWPVPTPHGARDPAVAPDGSIYFAVRLADKIARFDPQRRRFQEWRVPAGTRPQGLVVAGDGKVLFGGTELHELDPGSGAVTQYKCPTRGSSPFSLIVGADGSIWFTQRAAGNLGRLDRASGKVAEFRVGADPYALAQDRGGNIWVTRMAADRITRFEPATGHTADLPLPAGSQPRRIALAPDGMMWVTLYGTGRLIKIDPRALAVVKHYALPGGPNGGPYTVHADAGGRIWVSELQTDTVVVLDPRNEAFESVRLPGRDAGVRSAAIDAAGRYWYLGSASGRIGLLQ